ncbi:hypothetical protein J2X61_001377 [Bacillus sp. 3255]|nr:hypothetical protein [Bacillus sp. 3255]
MGRIKPVSYVKPMSGGSSSPHLILAVPSINPGSNVASRSVPFATEIAAIGQKGLEIGAKWRYALGIQRRKES